MPRSRAIQHRRRRRGQHIMAMQLDPRYCKGNLFRLMLGTQEEARELMKEYDDKSLLPALVHLSQLLLVQTMMMAMEMPSTMTMIECEGVFSLAGLITMHFRNRMNLDNMRACVFVQKNLDLDAKVRELMASYCGEAAFCAVATDLLKPCGEDWMASQVLKGEGEGDS
eukprot:jgi/Tetstr1/447732/TSEL_000309.t1